MAVTIQTEITFYNSFLRTGNKTKTKKNLWDCPLGIKEVLISSVTKQLLLI